MVIVNTRTMGTDGPILCQCLMYNAVALVTNSKSKVARERAEFLVKVLDDVCCYWGALNEKAMLDYAKTALVYRDRNVNNLIQIHQVNSFGNQHSAINAIKVTCIDKFCSQGADAEQYMHMYRRALKLLMILWGRSKREIDAECDDLTMLIRKQRKYIRNS